MIFTTGVFRQTLAAIPVFFGEASAGFGYGWIAPTLQQQCRPNTELAFDTEQCSWMGSLHEFGAVFGPLIAVCTVDLVGRRKTMVGCTLVFFALWAAVAASRSVAVLYAVRFAFGLTVGVNDVCLAIYVGENFEPKLRGVFTSVSIAFFYVGEVSGFALTTYLPYGTAAAVNAAAAFVMLVAIFFTTETSQYLITRRKLARARKHFDWLRGTNAPQPDDGGAAAAAAFERMRQGVQQESAEKSGLKELLTKRAYYRPTLLASACSVLMMLTGYAAVLSYASIAFADSAWLTANQFTILFGCCQFAAVCASPFCIERLDRRTILLASFLLVAVIHQLTAGLYYAAASGNRVPYSSRLLFATITLYAMVYSFGLHPIFCIVRSELFPQNVKAIGGTVSLVSHSIVAFFTAKWFLVVGERYGMHANFMVFAFFSAVGALFAYKWIPETRGKTLAEIQEEARAETTAKACDEGRTRGFLGRCTMRESA